MKSLWLILFMFLLSSNFAMAENQTSAVSCEMAHQTALNKCKAYEHQVSASDLTYLSHETKRRAAEKEQARTLAMGKTCAQAQQLCRNTCSSEVEIAVVTGGDWGKIADLSSDCREGEVARHRKEMARRYRSFSVMASKIVHAKN